MGTLVLFTMVLLSARERSAMREVAVRANAEALRAVRTIEAARRLMGTSEPIVRIDNALEGPKMSSRLVSFLQILDDDVAVRDSSGQVIHQSEGLRAMSLTDRDRFDIAWRRAVVTGEPVPVRMRRSSYLLALREYAVDTNNRWQVVVAVSTASATSMPIELKLALVLLLPLLVGVSVAWAYMLAGRAFSPIDRMVDQVEAITDGRSLHRRLAIGAAGDELTRLALTLNEMIGRLETSFGGLRRFTADASHELKTPLAVLRADVERAMSPKTRKDDRAVALEEALEQVTRMAALVDSLLTLARADEGRFSVVRDPIAVDDLVREVVETARLLGEEAGLQIEAPTVETATVLGDLVRLRQLLLNLVSNAIKYTPRGGRVTIQLVRVEDQVHFSVRDTGVGIAAADLPYVFDRFWRADRSRSRLSERGGFGLGLAIAQWITTAHGGTLAVQSRLGRGSTFTVSLPTVEAVPEPVADLEQQPVQRAEPAAVV